METIASDLPLRGKLGAADAAAMAAGVAELAKAGLPLPTGLRALAEELPGRRLRAELCGMAARLDRGDSLEVVFSSASNRLPLHLHGLLVAGLRSGRLPEVMDEYVRVEQYRRYLRQSLRTNLAYLTFLSLAVTALAFFIQHVFLKEMGALIAQQKGTLLGVFSIAAWKMFGQIAWLSAGFSLFLLLMPLSLSNLPWMAWLTPLSDNLPFIGPLLRNLRLASFSRVTALLLENETSLPDVIRMAGAAAGDVYLARDCRAVASELERGRPLAESLADYRRFPRNLIPLVQWGQLNQILAQSFRVAAQLHDGRAKNQSFFISTIFAPFMFLLIAGFICMAGSVIAMPTIATIPTLIFMAAWRRGYTFPELVIPPGFVFSSMFSPVLLGVALLVAKRLITLRRDPTNENIIEMGLSITGWVLIGVGLTGNLMLMMGFLSLLWIPALIVVSLFIAMKRRRTMQQALLCTMAVSAERFIPLVPAIEAFVEDIGGKFGVRIAQLAVLLKNGFALPDALRQVKRIVPQQLVPIIRVGYESGALAEGLAEAAATEEEHNALWGSFSAKMLYIAAMPCIGSWLVLYMLLVTINSYTRIFRDFGTPLPAMTRAFMNLSGWASNCWPLIVVLAMFFGLLFFYGILRYLGVPLVDLPGTERILRRQHTAAIMDNLALAVEHNRPLSGVLQSLCECYPKKSIRRKLENVRFHLEHGGAWCESLYRCGLMRMSDLAVLQSAERAGNLAWALREMADSNRRRLAYRLNVAVQLLFPPAVLCFGAIVLLIVVAMFLPLINLITSLS